MIFFLLGKTIINVGSTKTKFGFFNVFGGRITKCNFSPPINSFSHDALELYKKPIKVFIINKTLSNELY
jgi:hypothetical protein